MDVLVTGGLGYIGSHTTALLHLQGHNVTVIDNLSNSTLSILDDIDEVSGKRPRFYKVDLRDRMQLEFVTKQHPYDAIIHFAGLKSVEESIKNPLLYYENNVLGTLNLLEVMKSSEIRQIIFSSSATVYGHSPQAVSEESPLAQHMTNSYAATKKTCEEMLAAFQQTIPESQVTALRYFNPVGAHQSGVLYEHITDQSTNLMPSILRALETKSPFIIHGTSYPTPDGTALRDFIHIMDLAEGHVAALHHEKPGIHMYNLGTGQKTTVLQLIRTFEKHNSVELNLQFGPDRPGDIPISFANPSKAERELNWKATRFLPEMVTSAYQGYLTSLK
ncbi:UDP-glucose 4-epimerase GalE [Chryseomicrobium palamuruense]|uniref:UDP-glucose 4-epimerase n=1 Tax=Chryseomicrobium palamuruense TaxID=682973 RepID=A0ABV8USR0_9BACL